jgi:hypothetical protein
MNALSSSNQRSSQMPNFMQAAHEAVGYGIVDCEIRYPYGGLLLRSSLSVTTPSMKRKMAMLVTPWTE